jgi:hypothetical protein
MEDNGLLSTRLSTVGVKPTGQTLVHRSAGSTLLRFTRRGLTLAASVAILCYLWSLNYNKLGSLYDYSIFSNAAGKFAAGLRPYRDFTSAMQTFPFWLAHGCELLFGPRYLALAYGNLLLSLTLFFVLVHYAKKGFSFYWAVLFGMAVTTASVLQHGIIWYNSIGLTLLSAITLKCADLLRSRTIRHADTGLLLAMLLLCGMTKLNFYAVAIGIVAFFTLAGVINGQICIGRKRLASLAVLAAIACSMPPVIEALANHVALSDWVRQVVLTPQARVGLLLDVFHPLFYPLEWNPFYPGTVLRGGVLFCLTVYGLLLYVADKEYRSDQERGSKALIIRVGAICLFWGSTCVLILTNKDIESLCMCFWLVGAIAMGISGQFPGDKWKNAIQASAIVLAVYFLFVGTVSVTRHSRILYERDSFGENAILKDGEPVYLRGVELSQKAARKLAVIDDLVKENRGVPIYWGPGLEMMNRIYGGVADPGLPLWYDFGTSVRDVDAQRLIDSIERSGAGLVVVDRHWYRHFPDALKRHLENTWASEEHSSLLVVYRKRPVGQSKSYTEVPRAQRQSLVLRKSNGAEPRGILDSENVLDLAN